MPTDAAQVLAVRPDPAPRDLVAAAPPQDTVALGHARRPDVVLRVNFLEVQTGMGRIAPEQTIRLVRFALKVLGERLEQLAEVPTGARLDHPSPSASPASSGVGTPASRSSSRSRASSASVHFPGLGNG